MNLREAKVIKNLGKKVNKLPHKTPLSFGGNQIANIRTIVGDETVTYEDHTLLIAPAANTTVLLPPPDFVGLPGAYFLCRIKRITGGGFTVTIDADTALIDGASTFALVAQYEGIVLHSDGTNWHIVGTF